MSEVVSKITKNAREVVLLSLSEFKGRRLIDIRVHVPGEQEGEWVPTPQRHFPGRDSLSGLQAGAGRAGTGLAQARSAGPGF